MPHNGTSGGVFADQEDTERLLSRAAFPDLPETGPTPWYQRNIAAAAAGCFGVIGIAVLVTALITVSSNSAQPVPVHPGVSASASPRPTPTSPPDSGVASPPATAAEPPPTVPETVATESQPAAAPAAPTAAPAPFSRPTPTTAPRWWHRLFPHRYPSG